MRRTVWCALAALLALSACKREPSFDERYAGAQKAIRDKAGELDRDIAQRASEAASGDPQASGIATNEPAGNIRP